LYERFLGVVEPALFTALLEHCGNNQAFAARRLGIHRATLREKLRRYGLKSPTKESDA
jgi:DNA-binding protein Fis